MAPCKKCSKCGQKFRSSAANELWCAKCEVNHCQVPPDTDEEFQKLCSEMYGPSFADMLPINDILNHKARLKKLEDGLKTGGVTRQEENRHRREISRIRQEIEEMDKIVENLKAKMMRFAFIQNASKKAAVASVPSSPSRRVNLTTPILSPKSSPIKSCQKSPPRTIVTTTTPSSRSPPQVNSLQRKEEVEEVPVYPKLSSFSPVKSTAAKFEEAAKMVKVGVTFAKEISNKRLLHPPEVNNNDTPVTASSSSDEETDEAKNTVHLKRSNSVRDRVKAFEEIQRRASTGSCDRKRKVGERTLSKSMKILNA